jgi:hypothetical protein
MVLTRASGIRSLKGDIGEFLILEDTIPTAKILTL